MYGIARWALWSVFACVFAGCALIGAPAAAQHSEWYPPEPSPEAKDWLKLNSGEWLRGSIDLMRDDKLFFDSDELDDLIIDWEDIAEIRSPRILTFTFGKRDVATGTCSMRDGIIKIDTGTGIREFDRTGLLSILEGRPREINFWSLKATLGLIARSGNTDQADLNTYLRLRREAMRTRFNAEYTNNVGTVGGEQNVNNQRGNADFNVFVSRRVFVTPLSAELVSDKFQNIDYRATVGAGFGYYLWRLSAFEWYLGLGGAYRSLRYVSVQEGEDQSVDNGSVVPNLAIDWDITGDIEFDLDYNSQIGVPDPKNTFHYLFALLSVDLLGSLDLDTSFQWNRNETPVADAEGNVPKRDDIRLSIGFGVDI